MQLLIQRRFKEFVTLSSAIVMIWTNLRVLSFSLKLKFKVVNDLRTELKVIL